MADFVAVLLKTIDGLKDNSPQMREKVYAKARATIEAKLAALNPPPPPVVADRQRQSLEAAIALVRSEMSAIQNGGAAGLAELFADLGYRHSESDADEVPELLDAVFRFGLAPPPEPAADRSLQFGLRGGKLSATAVYPPSSEAVFQRRLHDQLRKTLSEASRLLRNIENRHPEMVRTFREYASLVDAETEQLDVVSVWAVGGSLLSFADSYRRQNEERTTSEPLEPAAEALLTGI